MSLIHLPSAIVVTHEAKCPASQSVEQADHIAVVINAKWQEVGVTLRCGEELKLARGLCLSFGKAWKQAAARNQNSQNVAAHGATFPGLPVPEMLHTNKMMPSSNA